ncbi:VOC family protein [Thalassotalea euphylliae]|uniref:VOC family protein n=1 Tax=Thalassotalea euphylliae TaxID=1655234 RepID=UPI003632BEED
MTDAKINYLEFPAKDLAAIKMFYQKVFNWQFTDYGPEYTAFSGDTLEGGFYLADAKSKTSNGSVLVVFYSADLEDTQQAIANAGGSISKETFEFPGGRRFHFNDPCGNELAVWSDK